MSTDPLPPEPGDTGITGRAAEPADEDRVFAADLDEPYDEGPPPRHRPARPPVPPAPPHPGFWWAVLWCLVMFILSQIAIPIPVVILIVAAQAIRLGGVEQATDWLQANQTDPVLIFPLLVTAHVSIFLMALLGLRLAAGKSWPRQVAFRLPAAGHVLLAVAGVPAFWLLSAGLQLLFTYVLPPLGDILSYVVTAALLMLVVGAAWLVVRLTTGRDWVRELARAPLPTQVAVGPLSVCALVGIGSLLFWLVSPHIYHFDKLDDPNFLGNLVGGFQQAPWWLAMLVVGGCPMFSEEFWCRAFLGRGLVGRHGYVMGIIWTSLFFGAIHGIPQQAAMAAVLGIVLHVAYVASRSLLIPMLMHFLNNSLAVAGGKLLPAQLTEKLNAVETRPEVIPVVWFVAAGLLAAAVLWAFYTSRARLERVDGSGEPPWQPPYPGVAHPPPGSGTAVVHPWPGVLPTLAVVAGFVGLVGAVCWF
jgi:membrane protease YdiL (CAAX protease family)